MKRVMLMVTAAAFLGLGLNGTAREMKTVTGEVIDLNCQLKKGEDGAGEAHKDCAQSCARRGQPLAIMASDGLYIIKGDWAKNKNEKLIDFVATKVTVKGEVTEVNDKKMINVTDVQAAK